MPGDSNASVPQMSKHTKEPEQAKQLGQRTDLWKAARKVSRLELNMGKIGNTTNILRCVEECNHSS